MYSMYSVSTDAFIMMITRGFRPRGPPHTGLDVDLTPTAVGEPLNGEVFLQQVNDTQSQIERTIVEAAIAANPHPPLLYRVQELQRFMQSKGRSRM